MAAAAKAQELDPLSAYASSVMGWVLGTGREFDEALEQLQPVLDHTPDDLLAVYVAGSCYDWLSMYDKAVVQFRKAADLSHRAAFYVGLLGQTYAHAGRRSEAVSIREELRERFDHEYVPPFTLAIIEMALGNADGAFDWLDQGYRERDIILWSAKMNPAFDDFRSDPRFQALLRRMNFPQEP